MRLISVSADRIVDALIANQKAVVIQRMGLALLMGNGLVLIVDSFFLPQTEGLLVWNGLLALIVCVVALCASQHFVNLARLAIGSAPANNRDPQP